MYFLYSVYLCFVVTVNVLLYFILKISLDIYQHERKSSFKEHNTGKCNKKRNFRKSTRILVQAFLIILLNDLMLTLHMKQCYLLHTSFQKSTWIFVEKYKYTINFPVTNIKKENNCFVLKNYTLPKNEYGKKPSELLILHLDWHTSTTFCPRVTVNQLKSPRSEKLH